MMDSSLALGRLELNSPMVNLGGGTTTCHSSSSGVGGPAKEKQAGGGLQQAHLGGCVPLSHQVAGHKYGVDKVGILQHPDGTVLKQLQPPPRGPREMQFYSMVYAEDCCDPCLLDLQNHLPKYFGTWSSPDTPNDLYLKLEDVTRRFQKPCIMDVKIGQRSYDPFASHEKREQQIRKYPLMEEIGFLVLGMRVYKVSSDSYDSYDQHYGRGLLKDTIKDGVSKFFHNGSTLRTDAITASILKVQSILRWFETQSQLTFYASSLLFVYEGLPPPETPLIPRNPPGEKKKMTMTTTTSTSAACHLDQEVVEYNNNIHVGVPLDYSLSTMYAMHKKGCNRGHHGNGPVVDVVVNAETVVTTPTTPTPKLSREDNNSTSWKHPEHPNGNGIKAKLEEEEDEEEEEVEEEEEEEEDERGRGKGDTEQRASDVEVRMIDFAHVFSSESQDQGYVYGLKHLLQVLQQILNKS